MNIHEYQAKELLRAVGVKMPQGYVAFTIDEAVKAAQKMGGAGPWVVKAQIHAGGRGKGGGVKIAKTQDEVKTHAEAILGMTLVTHQTGLQGKLVKRLYIEEGCDIAKELYLSLVIDRKTGCLTFMASTEGGMDIEEVADHTPEKIIKIAIDPVMGLQGFHIRRLAFALGLREKQSLSSFSHVVEGVYKAFIDYDASLIEINPLVLTNQGEIIPLDAKMNFDDNAFYRQPEIEKLRDEDEEDPAEVEAAKHHLNYVKLSGSIGCLVNGAGLAMATMDIIKLHGAEPANFLDVGGTATKERIIEAFKIILLDPAVKGILVNIFGGIMRCDVIAEGIVAATKEMGLSIPLVARLEGTNVELGKEILMQSGLSIIAANDLVDAAKKVVQAINEKEAA